ncbi:MAG: Zn-ribbon domain-containing OB-fold protein [Candidatus Bathyarchaeota archaeon]|nr:Zn-ribbon domain-containing OB-fold protein [Candidatus Bathyarchaeota archaeon]MDH5786837.1 Zn-ribbon domain-containing OB-fold protein [Candidatus Bathyarchaeota archaeon]
MSFDKFGKISYLSETKVADFAKYLEKGKIMATRCNTCGKLYFPPQADCPDDLSTDMTWEKLSGKCKLLTYTTAHFAPAGFQDDVPYTIALAQCEEGVKVYALLSRNINENEICIGMDLKLTPLQFPNGRITYELKKA